MTEVVLLFPIFMLIVFIMAKTFALLVLVQKLEIASYYAARRWQLESHLNAEFANNWDVTFLKPDILEKVKGYLGVYDTSRSDGGGGFYSQKHFLGIQDVLIDIRPTQVWNVVTLTVITAPAGIGILCKYPKEVVCAAPYGPACKDGYEYLCAGGKRLEIIKYVPNRDRPIQFVLPGLK